MQNTIAIYLTDEKRKRAFIDAYNKKGRTKESNEEGGASPLAVKTRGF